MGLFDHFPYTNFHEMNLDWILQALKDIEHTMDQFVAINSMKYADPIQWNITSQYEKNTIVIDPDTGTAYISVQAVPSGVQIINTDYWTKVFDLSLFIVRSNKNFTLHVEPEGVIFATFVSDPGNLLIWDGDLYTALTHIAINEAYNIGLNIKRVTLESLLGNLEDLNTTNKSNIIAAINEVLQTVATIAGDLQDLDTTDKSNLVTAINEVLQTVATIAGDLQDLDTTDKSNLVAAINEVLQTVATIAGNLQDLDTTNKSNLVAAINEVLQSVATIAGDLQDLDTTDKSNLVAAINEVLQTVVTITGDLQDLDTKAGDLQDLYTTDKSNLVAAINEVFSKMGNLSALTTTAKNSLVAAINEINDNSAIDRHILFVGDSYGDNPNNTVHYPDLAAGFLGLDNLHYSNLCASGAGFTVGTTYLQQITAYSGDRSAITHIIVLGGTNDHTHISDIPAALSAFVTYAKAQYPNAEIIIGCLTWQPTYPNSLTTLQDLNAAYQSAVDLGCTIINNAWLCIHNYALLFNDFVHPNDSGQYAIAECIANFIKCGNFTNKYIKNYVNGTLTSSIGTWNSDLLRECQSDNIVTWTLNGNALSLTSAINIGTNLVAISNVSGGLIRGGYSTPYAPVTAIVNGATSFLYVVFSEGVMYVRTPAGSLTGVTSITFYANGSYPAAQC